MEIYCIDQNKNIKRKKDLEKYIIKNKKNPNELFELILKFIKQNKDENKTEKCVIINLREIKQQQQIDYYAYASNNYYEGQFILDNIKDLLSKFDKKNDPIELNIKKSSDKKILKLENIELKEEENLLNKDNPINEEYNDNPFLKLKKEINKNQLNFDSSVFDIFYFNKFLKEPCLIILMKKMNKINILRLKDNKILLSINIPKQFNQPQSLFEPSPIIKHFYVNNNDYLAIAKKNNLFVYNLSSNSFKYTLQTPQSLYIENLLLIKNTNRKMNYLVLSQKNIYLENNNNNLVGENIKVYNFDKGTFINNVIGTDNLVCYDIIYWKEDYIVICSNNSIKIVNFINSQTYHTFNNNFKNKNGYINYKSDSLIVFSNNDTQNIISFYDLNNKTLIKNITIKLQNVLLSKQIFKWNETYAVINCDKYIFIIDTINKFCINSISSKNINVVKKINHPKYGKCLVNVKSK